MCEYAVGALWSSRWREGMQVRFAVTPLSTVGTVKARRVFLNLNTKAGHFCHHVCVIPRDFLSSS